jgi:hypothetical protein
VVLIVSLQTDIDIGGFAALAGLRDEALQG